MYISKYMCVTYMFEVMRDVINLKIVNYPDTLLPTVAKGYFFLQTYFAKSMKR